MRTIHKFAVKPAGETRVMMHEGAGILKEVHLHPTNDGSGLVPVIWAEVDDEAPMRERLLVTVKTGQELPSDEMYIHVGSASAFNAQRGKMIVVHVYDFGLAHGGEEGVA